MATRGGGKLGLGRGDYEMSKHGGDAVFFIVVIESFIRREQRGTRLLREVSRRPQPGKGCGLCTSAFVDSGSRSLDVQRECITVAKEDHSNLQCSCSYAMKVAPVKGFIWGGP